MTLCASTSDCAYVFTNTLGNTLFQQSIRTFVTSLDTRRHSNGLLLAGLFSKAVASAIFYTNENVQASRAHPISGSHYNGIIGYSQALISKLTASTPFQNIATITSVAVATLIDAFSLTSDVTDFPSTLFCPNNITWAENKTLETALYRNFVGTPLE